MIRNVWELFRLALKGDESGILEGNLTRAIMLLAIPMMLEMVMESLFAVVDIFFVGKLGVNAIAVVGLTESMLTIIYSVGIGLSMGTTALVARRTGEKDLRGAAVAGTQSIYIAASVSIVIGAAGVFFSEDLLVLMGAEKAVITEGVGFTQIMLGLNVIIVLLFLINGIFRGAGDAALAMRALWIANGINIILDPVLIFGLGPFPYMGIEGAAAATVIGRAAGVAYQSYHLAKAKGIIKIHRSDWRLQPVVIKKLIYLSAGGAGQFLIGSASWIFLMRMISAFGSTALAGYTIAIRVIIFSLLPAWGISNAAATMVGQNLGAKQTARAEKSVWRTGNINAIYMSLVMVVYLIFSEELITLFTRDKEVLEYAASCLVILSLGYVFYAYGMVIVQSFNGSGDTKTPTIINFFVYWLFQIPLAYILSISFNAGAAGVFWAIPIAESFLTATAFLVFRKGKWMSVEL